MLVLSVKAIQAVEDQLAKESLEQEERLKAFSQQTTDKIQQMSTAIHESIAHYRHEQEEQSQQRIAAFEATLQSELAQEKEALAQAVADKEDQLVATILEEVVQRYGSF